MNYEPHDYQRFAIEYILSHPICAVFLSMGLGKTSITLTAIERLISSGMVKKVLVIAPLRVTQTWIDEILKWDHLRKLTYSKVVGNEKKRKMALYADVDIYVINRENVDWLVNDAEILPKFDMCVIDELSSFKNCMSKRFKAFMKFRPRLTRVVGLTGTPSPNGLMDLFAEYKCLDMGVRLERFITRYREKYFVPDKMNGPVVYSYKPRPGAEKLIYQRIDDITISMRALDHLKMPELINCRYVVRMDNKEKTQYDMMKKDLIIPYLDDDEISAANAATLSGKLSQMANGAVYSDGGATVHIHDRKLDALEDILEAANGQNVMVIYWFKHDLQRIEERLDKLKIEHKRIDSDESIREWNAGRLPVALVSPASAGHGLNLQSGGNIMVWFGLTFSLELYQHTVARLWRQGQKSETVTIEHIVTEGTVDEHILDVIEGKESSQNALMKAVKAELSRR